LSPGSFSPASRAAVSALGHRDDADAVAQVSAQRLRRAPEQRDQGLTDRHPERVPRRHADAGQRDAYEAARAQERESAADLAVQLEGRDRIPPDHVAHRQHEVGESLQREVLVTEEIRATGHAFLGLKIDEEERGVVHRARCGPDGPWQRDDDRAHEDGTNTQGRRRTHPVDFLAASPSPRR
jgi:hypothetical protein